MNNVGKAVGILALLATVFYAVRSYGFAPGTYSDVVGYDEDGNPIYQPSPVPNDSVPFDASDDAAFDYPTTTEDGADMPATNWKVNEYPKYAEAIANAERQYNIPTDLLARLIYQESRYRQDIIDGTNRSPVGAMGIAQFMPATAAELHVDRLDPNSSIYGAARYLKQMYDQFHTWPYALMAYNWGPGNLSDYLKGKTRNGKTITVPAETSTYVADITGDVPVA